MSNTYFIENQKKSTSSLSRLSKNEKINLVTGNITKNNQKYYKLNSEINNNQKEQNEILSNLLDNLNKSSLNIFYKESNSEFKKKIDDLNLKFYLETEKYLSNPNKQEKTQSSLFIILFKQINLYIEEIERLNLIILEKKYEPKFTIERTDEIIKKQKNLEINQQLIKTLKDSKSSIEGKLLEALLSEDRLKKENEKLKQENEFFKKKYNSNNISKNQTQTIFHTKTFNNFINSERGITDITKANSNLSNENTFDYILNKKRNNSDHNNTSLSFGYNIYHHLVNHFNQPKKSLGIIKSVKNQNKIDKNFYSDNISNKNISENSKPISEISDINNSNNNKIQDLEYISDLKNIDFNNSNLYNNNNNIRRTEIIVSDLEDYYANNNILIDKNSSKDLISFNKNNCIHNSKNCIIKKKINQNLNACSNKNLIQNNNNKKIIQKKIPVIKVKMNK